MASLHPGTQLAISKNCASISLNCDLSPISSVFTFERDIHQLMCFVKMQECPDKVANMFGVWLLFLTVGV